MINEDRIGSNFDDFLFDEGILDEVETIASKRVIAFAIEEEMKKNNITKTELSKRMTSSRSAVDRLLDPANPSVTLSTLERAAHALGKKLAIQLM
jgi:DNA-binding Xre family transcriptional regulator